MSGALLAAARAPGKLILLGEHAVVHGHPAIAGAVGLHTMVLLFSAEGPTALGDSDTRDERLQRALAQALPREGLRVDIHSELPIGRGMGSSASVAVALVRAAAALAGRALAPGELFERSFALEKIFHGQPSGVDNAVVAAGGLLRFRRGPPLQVEPLALARPLDVVVLDSGTAGDTAALVAAVRARRPLVDPVLDAIGALVERAGGLLDEPAALGAAMDENHALLQRLGVSTPALDELCALARAHGALGAKLSGSGGGAWWSPSSRRAARRACWRPPGAPGSRPCTRAAAPTKDGSC
ncbi:MAG: mevalonate kinase [Pseudomonadota bacterium]